mmetsp:Transcript_22590/g.20060  ORF Transcript_22590/g.20060 Transcript_22590/m.20060 type:complete len:80 (+) Transcript_22590:477-716(+)
MRGPSPMISKGTHKPTVGKQIQVKPLSYRESTRYPSQTSISTSTSTKNQVIKPIGVNYEIDNPELLKRISSYYKKSYKY